MALAPLEQRTQGMAEAWGGGGMAGCGTQDAGPYQDHPRSGVDGEAELLQGIHEMVGAIPPPCSGLRGTQPPRHLCACTRVCVCVCACTCFPSSSSLLWGFSVLQQVLSVMASTRSVLFLVAYERMCKYPMRHYFFPLSLESCLPTAINSSFEHFAL